MITSDQRVHVTSQEDNRLIFSPNIFNYMHIVHQTSLISVSSEGKVGQGRKESEKDNTDIYFVLQGHF